MPVTFKTAAITGLLIVLSCTRFFSQSDQLQTQLKVKQLIEKKAEYNRLTGGQQDGYHIKIYFGVDRDRSKAIRAKFAGRFAEYATHEEYEQPNWVVLVGDFKTQLEALESLKRVKPEFPNAFIVKGKLRLKD